MLKITGLNRKVMINASVEEPFISNPTCNAIFAVDPVSQDRGPFKAHFDLTEEEARRFDDLCLRIELRLGADIADYSKPERPQSEALSAGA